MRYFSFLFDSEITQWSVIAKDDSDDYWYVVVHNIGDELTARDISEAMNLAERVKYKQN